MPKRVLLRGGDVLSMDARTGDIYGGDVLIEGDRIASVAPSIEVAEAEVIDASGCIVMPGLHRLAPAHVGDGDPRDCARRQPRRLLRPRPRPACPAYRPEDVYAGNYLGSLEAIDAGVTTVLDWSHISNTPEHADEAIRGLRDARLRAVYCYGNPNTSLADWWYTSTLEAPEDIRRVRDRVLLERRRPADAGDGYPWPRLLHPGGRPPRLGPRPRRWRADQRSRRNGAVCRAFLDGEATRRAGSPRRRHDLHPLQLPLRRGVPADRRLRREDLDLARRSR